MRAVIERYLAHPPIDVPALSPSAERYLTAILATYDAATPAMLAAGLAWYGRAEATMRELARAFGVSRETAAGVVAALSPSVQWSTSRGRTPNLDAARAMLSAARDGRPQPIVAGYGRNRDKAWSIANGAAPESILGGVKVTAFFANLTGDVWRVTIDRWAVRAAGIQFPDGTTVGRVLQRDLTAAYLAAAAARGVAPRDIQAACWVDERGAA